MKHIDEKEFEAREVQVEQNHLGLIARAVRYLAALTPLTKPDDDLGLLSARLRRDAGIDELEIERKRVIRAPLIR